METRNLSTLKIHKLSQEQYLRELEAGNIDEYALYLTPSDDGSDKQDKLMGYTDTMKLVNIDADDKYIGKIIKVKITEVKTWSMDGVVVND